MEQQQKSKSPPPLPPTEPVPSSTIIFPSNEWKERMKLSEYLRELNRQPQENPLPPQPPTRVVVTKKSSPVSSEKVCNGTSSSTTSDDNSSDWIDTDEEIVQYARESIREQLDNITSSVKTISLELRLIEKRNGLQPRKKRKPKSGEKKELEGGHFIFTARPESLILAAKSLGWLIKPEDRLMFEEAVLKQQARLNCKFLELYKKGEDDSD
jgi:hypothetical protein